MNQHKPKAPRQKALREADLFGRFLFGAEVPKDAHYSLLLRNYFRF
ncbi:MAG: hypothetical protein F6K47_41445 [Symploca sp. SIO2E6]|nr:hypothetical protein [Symploca sp. SIO2E6]